VGKERAPKGDIKFIIRIRENVSSGRTVAVAAYVPVRIHVGMVESEVRISSINLPAPGHAGLDNVKSDVPTLCSKYSR
jgi:hypothetical protein